MSKETKDIPPIPTLRADPPASPPSFIPKKRRKIIASDVFDKGWTEYRPDNVPNTIHHDWSNAVKQPDGNYEVDEPTPKINPKEKLPNDIELPRLTFVCLSCNIRVTIQPVIMPITFDKVFCPICRTLYMYACGRTIKEDHQRVGSNNETQKINDRHNAIDLLYQMRYTCQCVGPEPENGWCKHCKRLLQDE